MAEHMDIATELFPAPAGVILIEDSCTDDNHAVPRTRGGDPWAKVPLIPLKYCSPHPRG